MPQNIETTVRNNYYAAQFVKESKKFEDITADLVSRNIKVAVDRLGPTGFDKLSDPAKNALIHAARAAEVACPADTSHFFIYPDKRGESHPDWSQVEQSLYRITAELGTWGVYSPEDESAVTTAYREAVYLGSVAFTEIVADPVFAESQELQNTTGYFADNANPAAQRAFAATNEQ